MSEKILKQLLKVAARISDSAADETGFVTLAALAREIQADVRFRPLLVEGLAAQPKSKDGRWLVLIDSETHAVSDDMLSLESAKNPLGARVRNTVAHELAHALGPRYEELIGTSDKSREEIVDALERETEQLSPALLIPGRAMDTIVRARTENFSIAELVEAKNRLGVSARVFVKRFELLTLENENPLRHHRRLDNLTIGSAEWSTSGRAELHLMPFKGIGGLIPEFAALLRERRKISVAEYFPSLDFYLNGGGDPSTSAAVWLGTSNSHRSEMGEVELSVEVVSRKSSEAFLWMARQKHV